MPTTFTPPRLAGASPTITDALEKLAKAAEMIEQDRLLSPEGRKESFTREHAAPAIKRLEATRPILAAKLATLSAKLDALGASPLAGAKPSPDQRQMFLHWLSSDRDSLFARVTSNRVDAETQMLRRLSLEYPSEVTKMGHAHDLITLRLKPSLPAEAHELAVAANAITKEMGHLEEALDSIAAAADRDVLEAEGAVGKRITQWSPEERAAYLTKYGTDALARAVAREALLNSPIRDGNPFAPVPDGEATEQASKDMSDFLASFVDPAEAAADAALKPAT